MPSQAIQRVTDVFRSGLAPFGIKSVEVREADDQTGQDILLVDLLFVSGAGSIPKGLAADLLVEAGRVARSSGDDRAVLVGRYLVEGEYVPTERLISGKRARGAA